MRGTKQSYLDPRVELRVKSLAGKGIFASAPIKKDDLVCLWGGKIYHKKELDSLPEGLRHYILQVDEYLYIGPPDLASVDAAEYFNHCCDANCGFSGQTALVALRDIAAGEELTFDYSTAETYNQDWTCACGSPLCRKNILGTDHNLPELRKQYRGYFSIWLEKKHAKD